MRNFLAPLFLIPLIASCGAQQTQASSEPLPPPYCVASLEVFEEEGYAILDLQSRWTDDEPMKISLEYYREAWAPGVERTIPNCT